MAESPSARLKNMPNGTRVAFIHDVGDGWEVGTVETIDFRAGIWPDRKPRKRGPIHEPVSVVALVPPEPEPAAIAYSAAAAANPPGSAVLTSLIVTEAEALALMRPDAWQPAAPKLAPNVYRAQGVRIASAFLARYRVGATPAAVDGDVADLDVLARHVAQAPEAPSRRPETVAETLLADYHRPAERNPADDRAACATPPGRKPVGDCPHEACDRCMRACDRCNPTTAGA